MAREHQAADLPRLGDVIVVDGQRKYTVTSVDTREHQVPRDLKDAVRFISLNIGASDRPGDDADSGQF